MHARARTHVHWIVRPDMADPREKPAFHYFVLVSAAHTQNTWPDC